MKLSYLLKCLHSEAYNTHTSDVFLLLARYVLNTFLGAAPSFIPRLTVLIFCQKAHDKINIYSLKYIVQKVYLMHPCPIILAGWPFLKKSWKSWKSWEKGLFGGEMLEKLEFNILFSRPRLEKLEKVYFSLFRIYYIYPCLFISARGCPVYVDAMIYYLV